jgi:hypothetical protein
VLLLLFFILWRCLRQPKPHAGTARSLPDPGFTTSFENITSFAPVAAGEYQNYDSQPYESSPDTVPEMRSVTPGASPPQPHPSIASSSYASGPPVQNPGTPSDTSDPKSLERSASDSRPLPSPPLRSSLKPAVTESPSIRRGMCLFALVLFHGLIISLQETSAMSPSIASSPTPLPPPNENTATSSGEVVMQRAEVDRIMARLGQLEQMVASPPPAYE